MKSIGKILELPVGIREQVNQRLHSGQKPVVLLAWLNGLPEAQAMLAQKFEGRPITKQNLSEYKKHSFRDWALGQDAIRFFQAAQVNDLALQKAAGGQFSALLSRWAATHYATLVHAIANKSNEPEAELRRLNAMTGYITALRRGDLLAERINIEQQRLALERHRSEEEMEALHWEWTKRPDVNAKLYPHRDPETIRRDVDRIINHAMLGTPLELDPGLPDDPACFI